MEYNATATLPIALAKMTDAETDRILDDLADYHPAIGTDQLGGADVIITLPAESLQQAIRTAQALLQPLAPVALEVTPTALWDARADAVTVPPLASVTEAAGLLGVSRQAVLQRIESGSLPAGRVGNGWVIPRAMVR